MATKHRAPKLTRVVINGKELWLKPHALKFWRLSQKLHGAF
jgi:hypothetical protein